VSGNVILPAEGGIQYSALINHFAGFEGPVQGGRKRRKRKGKKGTGENTPLPKKILVTALNKQSHK